MSAHQRTAAAILPRRPLLELVSVSGQVADPARTVLVADDEAVVRTVLSAMLQRLGFNVLTADDGASAIQLYTSRYFEIGMVIFDLMLPDMTGEQLYNQLRRVNPTLRAMLITGQSESELLPQLRDDGVSGVLPKPFDFAELQRAVGAALAV